VHLPPPTANRYSSYSSDDRKVRSNAKRSLCKNIVGYLKDDLKHMWLRRLQAGLVVAVVALLTISTSAAPAPFGAYLGCYNLGKMGLSSAETRVSRVV
jgi:hypothetical protein